MKFAFFTTGSGLSSSYLKYIISWKMYLVKEKLNEKFSFHVPAKYRSLLETFLILIHKSTNLMQKQVFKMHRKTSIRKVISKQLISTVYIIFEITIICCVSNSNAVHIFALTFPTKMHTAGNFANKINQKRRNLHFFYWISIEERWGLVSCLYICNLNRKKKL